MVNFFKNLFKSKPKNISLTLDEVPAFVEEHLNSFKKNSESVSSFLTKITELLKNLRTNLRDLEIAKLKNKNIEKKIINVMEGNRTAFIKKAEIFINSCNIPKTTNIDEVNDFIENYKLGIPIFNKNTEKAFYVLKEFFGDNMKVIGLLLKQIDEIVHSIEKTIGNIPSQIAFKIKEDLVVLSENDEKKRLVEDSIKKKEEELEAIKNEIKETENLIAIKKKSESYLAVGKKEDEKENCLNEIKSIENEIIQIFSPLQQPLKKLSYSSPNYNFDNYISHAVSALKADKDLTIISQLQTLRAKINNDSIQIKDKRKESAISSINKLSRNYLNEQIKKLSDLENKKKEINSSILSNKTLRELSEMNYKLDHMKEKIVRKEDDISNLKKTLNKYDSSHIIDSIKENLNKLSSMEVSLNI